MPAPARRRAKAKGKGSARRGRAGGKRAKRGPAAAPDTAAEPGAVTGPRSAATPTGQTCPECGKPLVTRTSKFGQFVGCSGFPKCRYILKQEKPPAL